MTESSRLKTQRLQRMVLLSALTAIVTMALKFWAWSLTDAVSLLSDALESLVNLLAAGFAFVVLTIAAQPADAEHPFGHDKAEYFSSAAEGVLILVAAGGIAWTAWGRLQAPVVLVSLNAGLIISVIASLLNGLTALKLLRVAQEEDSLTLRADGHHLMSDFWTSVAIVAGMGLVWLMPAQAWLDPFIALLVSGHLVLTSLKLLAPSLAGLMDEALPPEEVEALRAAARRVLPASAELGTLRTRKSGHRRFVDGNLLVPGDLSVAEAHALCDTLESAMHATLPACDITLHLAPEHARDTHR